MSGDRSDDDSEGDGGDRSDRDPFADGSLDDEHLDDPDDPFAALGDEGVDDGGSDASSRANVDSDADPEPGAPADDPFAELDADSGDAAGEGDPFESMDVGDVGEEDVWDALDEETSVGGGAAEFDAGVAGGGEAGDAATQSGGPGPRGAAAGDERVIDKRSYCQQCPHFSEPPETACTHEGTEIVESVDFSRFRVRNCPMIDADDPAFDGE
ncbi:hypothetical protein [Halorubrum tebenquichense]|uniref:DUF8135 domain-containing protein n=1 Tax=Halorubrum tebenquichense DSM 14210 TaxID=1227485 RepID=M0DFL0_9EURY|nr:hypothetical protein [Halorubrum tebenquichense]ELZ33578.1 hypothetical protein C472_14296 [Halorubrum tebenquichense DSM 14210]